MFERCTERVRRVIFFAGYEASQFGSTTIEAEHLLLGLFREDKMLTNRFLRNASSVESIREEIESRSTIREKITTSIDLPLSDECKRILGYAAEESKGLNQRHIGTEHVLLGILREEKCFAAQLLYDRGLRLYPIRDELTHEPMPPDPGVLGGSFSAIRDQLHGIRASLFPFRHNPALPEAGIVPDAGTAIRIAEAVWVPLYSAEMVESQKPLQAGLKYGVVWIVSGSPGKEATESALSAFILKADGRILAVGLELAKRPTTPE